MKRIIVASYERLAGAGVLIVWLAGVVVGFDAGFEYWGDGYALHGMVLGVGIAFLISVLVFAPLFLVLEINETLRKIELLLHRSLPSAEGD